ncbi:histidine kinase [Microcoleus sp. FACHB-68]|nr:histidine kinase [Microcoleus sp. FACHB-68]
MALVAFFLGLALGLGVCLSQRLWLHRQLQRLLAILPADDVGDSLPSLVRLRRSIVQANIERQQLEVQLQLWRQLLQVAPMGYLQVDEENQLLWCNEQARQLLNIQNWEPERSRLLLKVVRSFELDELIEQTRHQQQQCQCEWVFHPAISDAEALSRQRSTTLRGYSWPLPDGQVGVFLENRQDLVTLAHSRNRWVTDLTHELRTPLTSIRLVAEALQERLEPPMRNWAERLLLETNRLIKLVQDWLDLIQIEADPSKNLTSRPLELPVLIQSAWLTLEPLAKQKQLDFAYSGPDRLALVADESRLTQVFLNLFDNSIRYSPPQSTIQAKIVLLPSQNAPTHVQIDIFDSGQGFPEADLPHVFERLYRGEPSRSRSVSDYQKDTANPAGRATDRTSQQQPSSNSQTAATSVSAGSGLGLAIVRQIVLAHGGSITAHNHPETRGAWLQIHLPYEEVTARRS